MNKPEILSADGKTPLREMVDFSSDRQFQSSLSTWTPPALSGDAAILPGKARTDSRAKDLVGGHAYAASGVQLHVDSIVGDRFKLVYKPQLSLLGIEADTDEAIEFIRDVELKFNNYAESPDGLVDAEGKRTLTQLVRHTVSAHVQSGESFATAEWLDRDGVQTAIKLVNADRISNPVGQMDGATLRAGVVLGKYANATHYWIRMAHSSDARFGADTFKFKRVAKQNAWGRYQVIHSFDPVEDGQTRGRSQFHSIIKRLKMFDKYQDSVLQNAIANAQIAITLESEFGADALVEVLGGDTGKLAEMLKQKNAYYGEQGVSMDGVRAASLFPGERLNREVAAAPTGTDVFEQQLLRYVAAGMGVSYEQLSRDYTRTNYSSARASMMESWRYFMGQREVIAKRFASHVFRLWFEEAVDSGLVVLPSSKYGFYDAKDAWTRCNWIGAGRLMIDGLKEVKQLVLELESGLISYEEACAQLGRDYQEVLDQQIRETRERKAKGLALPSYMQAEAFAPAEPEAPAAIAAT